MCEQYFCLEQGTLSLEDYYSQIRSICEELKTYHLFTPNVTVLQKPREELDVVFFLIGLKPEYELIRLQILGGFKLPSLLEVFSCLLCYPVY